MSIREEQCNKVCRILDDVLANRTTERDSLIVAVRKAFESLEQFGNSEPLPSAQPEPKWIPCSERLPEEDYCTARGIQHSESVLVTIVHHANDDDVFVDMACTVDGKWQLTHPIDDDPDIPKWCEVIAWMPLPEPYREDKPWPTC